MGDAGSLHCRTHTQGCACCHCCWCSCDQLQGDLWAGIDEINIYNILEDCHYEPTKHTPSVLADRKRAMALLQKRHNKWPLRPVRGFNQTIHNWATLLGDNPPCVVSP